MHYNILKYKKKIQQSIIIIRAYHFQNISIHNIEYIR